MAQPFVFFWQPHKQDGYLSNWYPAKFCEVGANGVQIPFNHIEQYMMWRKATLFGDYEAAQKILQARTPKDCKNLGRKINGFDLNTWYSNRVEIVQRACWLKFDQNPELKQKLLDTGIAYIAEASPFDKIWGIGLNKHQAKDMPSEHWRGQNLLGNILMEIRNWFQQQLQAVEQPVDERTQQRSEEGEILNAAKRIRSVSA